MKKISVVVLVLLSTLAFSQTTELEKKLKEKKEREDGWIKGGVGTLTFSQTSLSSHWAAGGNSSMTLNGLVNLFANYKKGNSNWDNTLDIGYGVIKQFKQGEASKVDWTKSDDKLDFASKYGRKAFKDWYYAAMINFKTQMTPGYDYPADTTRVRISDIFAPAYILGAIGLDYKPTDNLTLFIAPVTSKTTIVNDQEFADKGNFGVDPATYDDNGVLLEHGKKIRSEVGGYLKFFYKKEVLENITLQTKADLFSNYMNEPQNVDVNWETLIAMKVNKYITVNLTTHLIYDHDIKFDVDRNDDGEIDGKGARTQFKEVFGAGLSYKF